MRLLLHLSVAALFACSTAALADTFDFSFTGQDHGHGTFTATETSPGEYLITDITGKMNGHDITGLIDAGEYPPDTSPQNDNILYDPKTNLGTGKGYLDESGFAFTLANGNDVNIYFEGGYFLIKGVDGTTYQDLTSFKVTDVMPATLTPEPSSLLLLGTGLLGIGGLFRRRVASPRLLA